LLLPESTPGSAARPVPPRLRNASDDAKQTLSQRVTISSRCSSDSASSFVVTLDLRIAPQLYTCPPHPRRSPASVTLVPSFRVQTALMTVIKFGWIQFICIYFLLWWASEHFLRQAQVT
jgi:hypothetical protein